MRTIFFFDNELHPKTWVVSARVEVLFLVEQSLRLSQGLQLNRDIPGKSCNLLFKTNTNNLGLLHPFFIELTQKTFTS